MKIHFVLLILLSFFSSEKRKDFTGSYKNYFGGEVRLNPDSTFKYTWRFGLSSSWSNGTWSNRNDTIYFKMTPIYDTLRRKNVVGIEIQDSLVLSSDETSEIIDYDEYLSSVLISGGQNRFQNPERLYFKKNRLLMISKEGNVLKAKKAIVGRKKKYRTWHFRKSI